MATNVKAALESRVIDWAEAQTPPIPVALENVPFVKPQDADAYLEVYFLAANTLLATVDATRERETGLMQINVCVKDGTGNGVSDLIIDEIKTLFPVVPKTEDVSIERPVQVNRGISDDGWWKVPLDISYRQER